MLCLPLSLTLSVLMGPRGEGGQPGAHTLTHAHIQACSGMYKQPCTHTDIHRQTDRHAHTHSQVCTHNHIHTHEHAQVCTHTHKHILTRTAFAFFHSLIYTN